jgi:hypothetical protein
MLYYTNLAAAGVDVQPEDVAIFGLFKHYFTAAKMIVLVSKLAAKNATPRLTYLDFNACFTAAWEQSLSRDNILRGYRQTGFHPCNRAVYWQQIEEEKKKKGPDLIADMAARLPTQFTKLIDIAFLPLVAEAARAARVPATAAGTPSAETGAGGGEGGGDADGDDDGDGDGEVGGAAAATPAAANQRMDKEDMWRHMGGVTEANVRDALRARENELQEKLAATEARKEARATANAKKTADARALADVTAAALTSGERTIQDLLKNEIVALLGKLGQPVQGKAPGKEELVIRLEAAWRVQQGN